MTASTENRSRPLSTSPHGASRPRCPAADAVLFDRGTPVPLRRFLTRYSVRTLADQQWSTLGNGELLDAAEAAGFEILVTTDKTLRHQQNLAKRTIAIVVLGRSQWPILQLHVERVVAADAATPGSSTAVEIPD